MPHPVEDAFGVRVQRAGANIYDLCRMFGLETVLNVSAQGNMCGMFVTMAAAIAESERSPMAEVVSRFLEMDDVSGSSSVREFIRWV